VESSLALSKQRQQKRRRRGALFLSFFDGKKIVREGRVWGFRRVSGVREPSQSRCPLAERSNAEARELATRESLVDSRAKAVADFFSFFFQRIFIREIPSLSLSFPFLVERAPERDQINSSALGASKRTLPRTPSALPPRDERRTTRSTRSKAEKETPLSASRTHHGRRR